MAIRAAECFRLYPICSGECFRVLRLLRNCHSRVEHEAASDTQPCCNHSAPTYEQFQYSDIAMIVLETCPSSSIQEEFPNIKRSIALNTSHFWGHSFSTSKGGEDNNHNQPYCDRHDYRCYIVNIFIVHTLQLLVSVASDPVVPIDLHFTSTCCTHSTL